MLNKTGEKQGENRGKTHDCQTGEKHMIALPGIHSAPGFVPILIVCKYIYFLKQASRKQRKKISSHDSIPFFHTATHCTTLQNTATAH